MRPTQPTPRAEKKELLIAAIATFYALFMLLAAGPKFLLLSFVIYAPGTILFAMARREQGRRVFSTSELVLFVIAAVGAITGIVALIFGWVTV